MPLSSAAAALIVFGGGWGAEGTQASIEAHVLALRSALGSRAVRVLFASGDPSVRDVQIQADEDGVSALLGVVFDRRDHLDVAYRASTISGAAPASEEALLEALRETAGAERGTIVFGAGHGAPASKHEGASLELFGPEDDLSVGELAAALDRTKRRAPIAFVLGQCHSGAFTELAYEGGDPRRPLAGPARCVLAAVPADRQASGCTPDVADPGARAYMALVADAIAHPAASDLDGNGRVSLAEAHAHARIHDRTIDLPVSTSEMWLERAASSRRPKLSSIALEALLPRARASERRVIEALRPSLSATPRSVSAEIERIHGAIDRLGAELDALDADYDRIRGALLDQLLLRYPELANPYHAESRRLLSGGAEEVVGFLRSRRELLELDQKQSEIDAKENERFELEKRAARLERWLSAVMIIANEDALRRSGSKRAIAALERLLACESLEP